MMASRIVGKSTSIPSLLDPEARSGGPAKCQPPSSAQRACVSSASFLFASGYASARSRPFCCESTTAR